jgi:replication initiation and membrane attachment protein DnaB
MKGPLYQLPQSPDIVPMTYEDIRGIITKNGAWGDGYRMLYEIMSRIHPILNPDAQLPLPHSGNFLDIHGYYNQFDAYVLHQKLLYGISMTKRQNVIQFLTGLDESYQCAIEQVKQHMMNWRQDDPDPPEALEITELPHTIEQIMQSYGETPIIRAMTQGKQTKILLFF